MSDMRRGSTKRGPRLDGQRERESHGRVHGRGACTHGIEEAS